jgi:hypothetical protein
MQNGKYIFNYGIFMLLNNIFNEVTHNKTFFIRKNGKLKKVTKPYTYKREPDSIIKDKPLFPISRNRDKGMKDENQKD